MPEAGSEQPENNALYSVIHSFPNADNPWTSKVYFQQGYIESECITEVEIWIINICEWFDLIRMTRMVPIIMDTWAHHGAEIRILFSWVDMSGHGIYTWHYRLANLAAGKHGVNNARLIIICWLYEMGRVQIKDIYEDISFSPSLTTANSLMVNLI